MRVRGASLIEIVVALGLAALLLPLVMNLLPTSALALQRAEDLQAATGLAMRAMDEFRDDFQEREETLVVNGSKFEVTREKFEIRPRTWDLVVTVQGPRGAPVVLATRSREAEE